VARHRKARIGGRIKKTDQKRYCPSGKVGFKQKGDAKASAAARRKTLNVYRCPDCKLWHLANPIGRTERRRRAEQQKF
jgi:hypothetical protein